MISEINYLIYIIVKSIKEQKQYKFNHIILILGNLVNIILNYYIISFIVSNGFNDVLSKREIFPYTILMMGINLVINQDNDLFFSQDYKEGTFAIYLSQPHSVFMFYLGKSLGKSLYYMIYLMIPIIFISFFVLKKFFFFEMIIGIFMILLSSILMFFIELLFAVFTIKLINNWGLNMLKNLIFNLFSGHIVPLFVVPNVVINILKISPFYFLEYPIAFILLGKFTISSVFKVFFSQVIWISILSFISYIVFEKLRSKTIINGG